MHVGWLLPFTQIHVGWLLPYTEYPDDDVTHQYNKIYPVEIQHNYGKSPLKQWNKSDISSHFPRQTVSLPEDRGYHG